MRHREELMEALEAPQLITLQDAFQRSNMPRRTFQRRLQQMQARVFIDPTDRRKRWLDRRDLDRLTEVQPERRRAA